MNVTGWSPCQGCNNRRTACHSSCQRYLDWDKKRHEEMSKFLKPGLMSSRDFKVKRR